ncbi:UDP-glycosyltransferase 76E1-like isoform X3 [Malus sylvestris]|uniref:UDP-glycosyltransferase 76E1-like isoform X3 n=1 Tax=Malus sylvestris TaxID=3752 RepID=UPI0021AD3872|nr:UDP-glycosyltransferase 76E1-like isoform X3 [Malus sylvestris]
MEKKTHRSQRTLVLVPAPYQGHINPMLQLGAFLHSKGFSITVVHTHFNSPNPSNHHNFTFLSIPDGLTAGQISSGNLIGILLAINANCKESFQQCLTQVMKQEARNDITCIIHDELMYFPEPVANNLNIPSLILRPNSATNFIARSALLRLHSKGYIPFPLPDSLSLKPVPELHPLRFKDLPISTFDTLENYSKLMVNAQNVRTSSAIIWNTPDCLEQSSLEQIQQQCQVPIFSIGPLHKIATAASSSLLEEDTSCIAWLDKQSHNSVIYVSLGSLASIAEKDLDEMAWGLANSEQPFLWVIRPGSVCGSDWIDLLPQGLKKAIGERGCIVKWAPQKEILSHDAVGGFWSHCGWNSTLESISEGVPMICKPFSYDQKVHARYISQVWKIGIELENEIERGEIERAVRKLMVGFEEKEMRVMTMELKENIEASVKSGSLYDSLNDLADLIGCNQQVFVC